MWRILFIYFLFFAAPPANEKYYVTFVKGSVVSERTKKPVKVGDALNPTDGLIFGSRDARLSCISPGKGRFDIELGKARPLNKGEWLAILSSALVSSSKNHKLSTRGIPPDGYEPKAYFHTVNEPRRVLIIEGEWIPIGKKYLIADEDRFTISFSGNNRTVIRNVDSGKSNIRFTRELFKALGSGQTVNMQYRRAGNDEAEAIAVFIPVVVSKEKLLKEIGVLKAHFAGKPDEFLNEVANHLYANYGKIEPGELKRVLGL